MITSRWFASLSLVFVVMLSGCFDMKFDLFSPEALLKDETKGGTKPEEQLLEMVTNGHQEGAVDWIKQRIETNNLLPGEASVLWSSTQVWFRYPACDNFDVCPDPNYFLLLYDPNGKELYAALFESEEKHPIEIVIYRTRNASINVLTATISLRATYQSKNGVLPISQAYEILEQFEWQQDQWKLTNATMKKYSEVDRFDFMTLPAKKDDGGGD